MKNLGRAFAAGLAIPKTVASVVCAPLILMVGWFGKVTFDGIIKGPAGAYDYLYCALAVVLFTFLTLIPLVVSGRNALGQRIAVSQRVIEKLNHVLRISFQDADAYCVCLLRRSNDGASFALDRSTATNWHGVPAERLELPGSTRDHLGRGSAVLLPGATDEWTCCTPIMAIEATPATVRAVLVVHRAQSDAEQPTRADLERIRYMADALAFVLAEEKGA